MGYGLRSSNRSAPFALRTARATLCAALIGLLSLFSLLPWVDHWTAADVASAPQFARFLCDMPLHDGAAYPATPHHHHVSLRAPVEPVLALAVTSEITLIVTARLLRARGTLLTALLRTPPTPPPRTA